MAKKSIPPVDGRIKKGEVRNPLGKKKGTLNFKTILKAMLVLKTEKANPLTKKREKLHASEHMMAKLIAEAMDGNLHAMGMVMDRVNGKATENQKSTITVKDPDKLKEHQEETARRAIERAKASEQ